MLQAFDFFDYEDCFDISVAEGFFRTLQLELLDELRFESRQQLASVIFDWIDAWSQPEAASQLLQDGKPRRRFHPLQNAYQLHNQSVR